MNLRRKLQRKLQDMKTRCYNEKNQAYPNYGGRGITVCDKWLKDSETFVKWSLEQGYDGKLTIDRVDNNIGYSAENCHYVDYKKQNRNTRQNNFITYKGETLCFSDWSDKLSIPRITLFSRIYRSGWSIEKAFETPVNISKRNKLAKV
jgi:hypothetical protein